MPRRVLLTAITGVLVFAVATAAQAAVTTNIRQPVDIVNFISCANGGAGELIRVTGTGHMVITTTDSANGGRHTTIHSNVAGLSGIGLTTGTKYRQLGGAREIFNTNVANEFTFSQTLRLLGLGPDASTLIMTLHQHATVNPHGVFTASFTKQTFSCE
jgi:hypothetical protein